MDSINTVANAGVIKYEHDHGQASQCLHTVGYLECSKAWSLSDSQSATPSCTRGDRMSVSKMMPTHPRLSLVFNLTPKASMLDALPRRSQFHHPHVFSHQL